MRSLRVALKISAPGNFVSVAQAVSHLVFADPNNQAARTLLADTFDSSAIRPRRDLA